MSEQSFFEEDAGEPPSLSLEHQANYQTGELYDKSLSEYYEALQPIQHLCQAADGIIEQYLSQEAKQQREIYGQYDVVEYSEEVVYRGARLRRLYGQTCRDYECGVAISVYFLIDEATGYCRSWNNHDPQVGWCFDEQRHEPPADVKGKLETYFPSHLKRRFGDKVLKRLFHR